MAEAATEPGYSVDERTKDGYVRLKIKIDGLKVKSTKIFDKLRHKHPHPEGKNAEIEVPLFHSRGFELHVRGGTGGEMKGAQYSLIIQQLPFNIEVDDSYITAEDGWIYMFLKKSDVLQSWEVYIRSGSLETVTPD